MVKDVDKKPVKVVAKTKAPPISIGSAGKGAPPTATSAGGVKTIAPNRGANLGSWLYPKKK